MRQSKMFEERMTCVFSPDRRYRYSLLREFGDGPRIAFVMLNPSVADEEVNDPTVTRCINRARALGFGSLEVVNLFAFRSTDPARLAKVEDPVGPSNDGHIKRAVEDAEKTVLAWGCHGNLHDRAAAVLRFIGHWRNELCVLGLNKDGSPKHPLYVAASRPLVRWKPAVG
jgi:hypothetical protein